MNWKWNKKTDLFTMDSLRSTSVFPQTVSIDSHWPSYPYSLRSLKSLRISSPCVLCLEFITHLLSTYIKCQTTLETWVRYCLYFREFPSNYLVNSCLSFETYHNFILFHPLQKHLLKTNCLQGTCCILFQPLRTTKLNGGAGTETNNTKIGALNSSESREVWKYRRECAWLCLGWGEGVGKLKWLHSWSRCSVIKRWRSRSCGQVHSRALLLPRHVTLSEWLPLCFSPFRVL